MGNGPILFRRLIDDAALFPPGNAPMAVAVPAHLARQASETADLVGPFLCPSSRLEELRSTLPVEESLAVGLIVDTGLDSLHAAVATALADDRLAVAMVEVALPPGDGLAAGALRALQQVPAGPRLYVELPRAAGWIDALDMLAAAGQGAKLRTGGLQADLFPTEAELARFIMACRDRAVTFKCTAGLHHAVRHTDPATGLRHHGFLNIVVATALAVMGDAVTGDAVEEALAEDEPSALANAAATVDDTTAVATRALFASYGSCDVDEPVADLRSLGLLPER